MYRTGIVGCGGMGRSHAAGWHARSDSEVVATADVNADAASALAAEYGAHSYTDSQEMLDGEALRSVIEKHKPDHVVPEIEALRRRRFSSGSSPVHNASCLGTAGPFSGARYFLALRIRPRLDRRKRDT